MSQNAPYDSMLNFGGDSRMPASVFWDFSQPKFLQMHASRGFMASNQHANVIWFQCEVAAIATR